MDENFIGQMVEFWCQVVVYCAHADEGCLDDVLEEVRD